MKLVTVKQEAKNYQLRRNHPRLITDILNEIIDSQADDGKGRDKHS